MHSSARLIKLLHTFYLKLYVIRKCMYLISSKIHLFSGKRSVKRNHIRLAFACKITTRKCDFENTLYTYITSRKRRLHWHVSKIRKSHASIHQVESYFLLKPMKHFFVAEGKLLYRGERFRLHPRHE